MPTSTEHFRVEPLSPTIGAVLHGVDLANDLDEELVTQIRDALLTYKVVFFRGQDLTEEHHVALGRHFGEVEQHPITPDSQANPEILRLIHDAERRGIENAWHTDLTWQEEPSYGSILRAVEVPECGGDTLFCDMGALYRGLPEELKVFLRGKRAVHDILRTFRDRVPPEQAAMMGARFPPVEHPVVRTHPDTGEDLLFVNIAFTERIVGLSAEASDALLVYLWNQADIPEYQCRFQWAPGSVAFWDNRACQHYAVSDYYPQHRVMDRVTIHGDRPFLRDTPAKNLDDRFGPFLKGPAVTPQILDLVRAQASDGRTL